MSPANRLKVILMESGCQLLETASCPRQREITGQHFKSIF